MQKDTLYTANEEFFTKYDYFIAIIHVLLVELCLSKKKTVVLSTQFEHIRRNFKINHESHRHETLLTWQNRS